RRVRRVPQGAARGARLRAPPRAPDGGARRGALVAHDADVAAGPGGEVDVNARGGAAWVLAAALIAAPVARAATSPTVDRVAVRYYAPETGGSARPRYVSERMLAFEARLEALGEQASPATAYQDRFVRAALDRHVAEDMLSALQVQQGTEPPDLPALAEEERIGLLERIGGKGALAVAMAAEGIDASELDALLRRRVRAAYYVDRS